MELERYWSELWWMMAKEDATQFEKIKGLDLFEFWRVYEVYHRNLKEKIKSTKNG